jgi:hypothetical protein
VRPSYKLGFIPVLKRYVNIDKREFESVNGIYDVLKEFFKHHNCTIVSVGSKLLSKPPQNADDFEYTSNIFDPALILDESHFSGEKPSFEQLNQKYVWQHIPFSYQGEEITSGVFDISTIVKINTLSAEDDFKTISYGSLHKTPIVLEHIYHLNSVIDTLTTYYISANDAKSTFVLPFHPLEHFLDPSIDFDEAMVVYQEWFGAYQAFSAYLQASKASFKVILGMPEWAYKPANEEELRNYVVSEGISDVYRSPHSRITDDVKTKSDTVNIDTVNSFDLGDIVTIITWQKNAKKQGQEFYYHVMGQKTSIDKLEKQYKCKNLTVTRAEIDLDENMDKLAMLNVSKSLN